MKFKRLGAALLAGALAIPTVALAQPSDLPEQAAERVAEAQSNVAAAAHDMASDNARGKSEDKTTGQARAAEVSNSWKFTGVDKPGSGNGNGNGNALGAGHADAVRAALAAGTSPSDLGSHGETVSAAAAEMVAAFDGLKANGNGNGNGNGNANGNDGEGGGDED